MGSGLAWQWAPSCAPGLTPWVGLTGSGRGRHARLSRFPPLLPHLDGVENGRDGLGEVLAGALKDGCPRAPLSLAFEDGTRLTAHLRRTVSKCKQGLLFVHP